MLTSVQYPQGSVLLRNLSHSYPIITHGDGIYLFDARGNRYLDAVGGAFVASIGHGQKEVAREIADQLARVSYVNGMQFTTHATEALAVRLAQHAAPLGLDRCTFLCSGSEAVEASIKFARQLCVARKKSSRFKIIARQPSYHGNTLYALSASARAHYKKTFLPLLTDIHMIPAPYEYRSPVDYVTDGGHYYARYLEEAILAEGPETVAAFIVEPISGSSLGGNVPPPGYFDEVTRICRKHGVLIIADEVLCGAGRTGKFFASEHFDLKPDILVLGKGISGGYAPLSAVIVHKEHVDELLAEGHSFLHAQTYMQAPCMTGAGLAVMNYYDQHRILENAAHEGVYLQQLLRNLLGDVGHVGFVSGIGCLAGIEFVDERASRKPFERGRKVAERFSAFALERGLVLWPNTGHVDGVSGDLIMIAPPLIINHAQIEELVIKLEHCIREFKW